MSLTGSSPSIEPRHHRCRSRCTSIAEQFSMSIPRSMSQLQTTHLVVVLGFRALGNDAAVVRHKKSEIVESGFIVRGYDRLRRCVRNRRCIIVTTSTYSTVTDSYNEARRLVVSAMSGINETFLLTHPSGHWRIQHLQAECLRAWRAR